MRPGRVVIAGGGPAALAAARAYREAGGGAEVLLLTDEDRPPYRRPPLSKELLRGEVEPEELAMEDAAWFDRAGVEVRTGTTVAGLDAAGRALATGDGGRVGFAACLLALGAEPARPPVPGSGLPGVHVLRSLRDALGLRAAASPGTRVVVVGSGFVGCEASASLAARGARVTMIARDRVPQQDRLGDEVGGRIAGWLAEAGVTVIGGRSVDALAADGDGLRIAAGDLAVGADAVLLATGARPRVALAAEAGLATRDGAVVTDAAMRTSADGVWCAGDLALAANAAAGRRLRVEHWGDALGQGEVAGRALAGAPARWEAVPGFWSTIGSRTLKHAAWGDGWDEVRVRDHGGGAFTAWYLRGGRVAGVLTHDRDADYEDGSSRVREGAPAPP
jgi:3-phenylpropionate/trans-cinnamate dioxygenase ferredoxin reductase component